MSAAVPQHRRMPAAPVIAKIRGSVAEATGCPMDAVGIGVSLLLVHLVHGGGDPHVLSAALEEAMLEARACWEEAGLVLESDEHTPEVEP